MALWVVIISLELLKQIEKGRMRKLKTCFMTKKNSKLGCIIQSFASEPKKIKRKRKEKIVSFKSEPPAISEGGNQKN